MSSNYTVLKGQVWKEYSSKKLILTLDGAAAGALQAAIPLWIAIVGLMTWILILYPWFLLSRGRATRTWPFCDAYYRQKQTLLRNSAGDFGTMGESWSLFWAWRGQGWWKKSFYKTAPLLIIATLFCCGWQATGVLSFYIWQTNPPTVGLVRGSTCGYSFLQGPNSTLNFRTSGLIES